MTEHRTVPVSLPFITPEIHSEFGRSYIKLIENDPSTVSGWSWTQRAVDFACLLNNTAAPPSELAELERELAERRAKLCVFRSKPIRKWQRTTHSKARRYLELRGLLERHPTDSNLVRVKE